MSFEGSDLLVCVVVKYPELVVIGASNKPVFSSNKATTANRNFRDFKCFDKGTCLMVVNIDRAIVETREQPRFSRMEIDRFYTVRAIKLLSLRRWLL
jgi:hypothetical protein